MEVNDEMVERAVVALDGIAVANQELIRLATEERDSGDSIFGPPVCPHCGAFGPRVKPLVPANGAPMSEFVLISPGGECGQMFFGVPQGWLTFPDEESAKQQVARRSGE